MDRSNFSSLSQIAVVVTLFFAACQLVIVESFKTHFFNSQYLDTCHTICKRLGKTGLEAITKRQTAVFDGAEFVSIASVLKEEESLNLFTSHDWGSSTDRMPSKKAGYMTFITGNIYFNSTNERILAILKSGPPPRKSEGEGVEDLVGKSETSNTSIQIEEGISIYKDSITTIPKTISDEDAISTAAAALSVRCASGDSHQCDSVILGGGDYACFVAKALSCLAKKNRVSLVTTRPMSLKDTVLNPLRGSEVQVIPPVVGEEERGFSDVFGIFDAVIDTLGDEGKLWASETLQQGVGKVFGEVGVSSKLKRCNNCNRYISTLTHSQQIILQEGIIFARDPVLTYQKNIENCNLDDVRSNGQFDLMSLPCPSNYNVILQQLFNNNIIFPSDSNEMGAHKNKNVFVRGCSFPDYAEIEIWPSYTVDGAPLRFGFPAAKELALETKIDKMMAGNTVDMEVTNKRAQRNPYVASLESLKDVRSWIIEEKKDAVVFFAAPYCKTCRSINPLYTRMARISKDVKGDAEFLFAKASITGKAGKQLTFTFNIDSVPTFVLFRQGKQFGDPFGIVKLPSKRLGKALDCLKSGHDWDPDILKDDFQNKIGLRRTKLR